MFPPKGFEYDTKGGDSQILQQETNEILISNERIDLQQQGGKDWRQYGAVTQIKDSTQCKQGNWAFAASAVMEGREKVRGGSLFELSAQQLIDCVLDNDGCQGGEVSRAFDYAYNKGIQEDFNYRYVGYKQKCLAGSATGVIRTLWST